MRSVYATGCLFLSMVGAVQAQVAVPKINTSSRDLASSNPSAIVWGAPTSVSASFAEGTSSSYDSTTKLHGPGTVVKDRYYGFRWVPDKSPWAFAADTNYGAIYNDRRRGDLAFRLNPRLGVGVGVTTNWYKNNPTFGSPSVNRTEADLGLSLNLGEFLYLGYVGGRETREIRNQPNGYRDFARYGIAVRGVSDKTMLYHFEYNTDVYLPDKVVLHNNPKETRSQAVAEMVFFNVLFGWERQVFYSTPHTEAETYTLGYSPREGLSFSGFTMMARASTTVATVYTDYRLNGVALALAF
ncbi:MAG: hypothetical protein OEV94_02520 [Deltaproteobacteria bacterium]|nr:hypothetical protein [Deltaproteobacteria bacterium]